MMSCGLVAGWAAGLRNAPDASTAKKRPDYVSVPGASIGIPGTLPVESS
jgi:hypothetical protein